MMSLDVLVAVNNEIARQAAREGLVPYVPASADEAITPFAFPNIGSLKPRGWRKTGQTWFVDKTGHGEPWEPALTWRQFRRQLAGYSRWVEIEPRHRPLVPRIPAPVDRQPHTSPRSAACLGPTTRSSHW